jgi:hypothetical protein
MLCGTHEEDSSPPGRGSPFRNGLEETLAEFSGGLFLSDVKQLESGRQDKSASERMATGPCKRRMGFGNRNPHGNAYFKNCMNCRQNLFAVLFTELINPTSRIHNPLFAGVKRMA